MFRKVAGPLVRSQEVCVVPKCCPIGQSYPGPRKSCQNSSLQFEPDVLNGTEVIESSDSRVLNIIVGNPCQYEKFRLEPDQNSDDEFYILCNGSLFAPFQSNQMYKTSHYCLDSFLSSDGKRVVTLPLLCSPPPPPPPTIFERIAMATYPVGLLISVPFLILTIMVYGGFPELRDTQGKSLCCHCVCLTVAYLTLAIVMLMGNSLSQTVCITLEMCQKNWNSSNGTFRSRNGPGKVHFFETPCFVGTGYVPRSSGSVKLETQCSVETDY
ncbi:hypothetical protein J6590_048878 [Homalodisca vitripennis]|nr:hypothetical protein J6590_048878 [Homalodisca vitripennis]